MKNRKAALRKQIVTNLSTIPKHHYEQLSQDISNRLFREADWIEAATIGITISKFPEVDTYPIIEEAWRLGKQVAIPKCLPAARDMDFRIFTDFQQLESVYSGLLEPIIEKTSETRPEKIDLLIVPGVAFNARGHRLGFGGGYYDRYLNKFHGQTTSLAFHMQMIDELPIQTHDLPVNKIITDKGVLYS
ncbi:5-formyltetrahydrofolate cyclo-ligase [Cytobacillus purgationiresistens]|uniref:5-formyltetrahydrofolate cyclo-ligase n=1 Tax=Cytobacillus purgationiresistens TaxID=863449 RepID=A0ABU0ADW7_9BACI|nr:5-formyltetrahydrofolate cyclo-ligase [Cytobacillus purgationiresistens]MDQ0269444.1 5-formyltetrahydrofolate cyclo-ligase [Cytobacillus purgationiresistens]